VAGKNRNPGRTVASKINSILLALADDDMLTISEVAARCDIPLSTVHRLMNEMAAWGVLERDDGGRYRVGARFVPPPPVDTADAGKSWATLRRCLVPVIDQLFHASGSPVRAGVLDGTEVAYIEKCARHAPVSWFTPAARLPAHATALGKALVAFADPMTVDFLLTSDLRRYTPATIVGVPQLHAELRKVRMTRVAVADGELDEAWTGVAAPACVPGGGVVAAVEVRVDSVPHSLDRSRSLLSLATGWLSRELTLNGVAMPSYVGVVNET
jgi:DNA-binding IclR family transcriptional regulator